MDTFYWFRDGEFGQVDSYTWAEAVKEIGKNKFFCDPDDGYGQFGILDDQGQPVVLPRWVMPKEFLLRLVLMGVPI